MLSFCIPKVLRTLNTEQQISKVLRDVSGKIHSGGEGAAFAVAKTLRVAHFAIAVPAVSPPRYCVTSAQPEYFPFMMRPSQQQSIPPAWLRWFVNDAVRGIVDRQVTAPVGCHFYHDGDSDVWEISLFVSRTEVCGGSADGKQVPSGLQIDIPAVCNAFDSPPATYWQSEKIADDDELGNHLSFEGIARGFSVWLRMMQHPPEWTGPGRLIHAESGEIEDVW